MVQIHYGKIDKDFQNQVSGSLIGVMDISETEIKALMDNNAEPNYVSFDGLGIDLSDRYKTFYQENDYAGGVFSTISDENCEMNESDAIQIKSNQAYSGSITIKFYGDCCREFNAQYTFADTHTEFETVSVDSD